MGAGYTRGYGENELINVADSSCVLVHPITGRYVKVNILIFYISQLQPHVNSGRDSEKTVRDSEKTVSLDAIHSRQILPSTGISAGVVIAIVLGAFFGTLLLAVVVAMIVIMRIRENANQQLEKALARLLISATAHNTKGSGTAPTDHINKAADSNQDGKIDEGEFSAWAKENNITTDQANMLWKELDVNRDKSVSTDEWENFIGHRPHLKFLVARMKSAHAPTE